MLGRLRRAKSFSLGLLALKPSGSAIENILPHYSTAEPVFDF
jgi:hypothetical protein